MSGLKERIHIDHRTVWAVTVFLLFCFYMFWPVNFYLAASLKRSYYMVAVPLLVGGVLYFRRLRDGLELKILLAYWAWFWISRILNGAPALNYDFQLTFDLALMIPFFGLGLALNTAQRRRFLDWLSAVTGGFFFLLGLLCLAAFVQRKVYINPITEGSLGLYANQYLSRLNVFDIHPNITAYWFLMPFLLMLYEFFACRNKLWCIPIALSAAADFLVIAITYSRSVRVSAAMALGLIAVMLVNQIRRLPRTVRWALLLVSFMLAFLFTYWASGECATGLSKLSDRLYPPSEVAEVGESAGPLTYESASPKDTVAQTAHTFSNESEDPVWTREDPRHWNGSLNSFSSNRLKIWLSAWEAIKEAPDVLLRGRLDKDTVVISNKHLFFDAYHFHNAVIQVLMMTGIPGLLLAAALILLLLFHGIRLLLLPASKSLWGEKILVLPVITALAHYMLEVGLFTACDVRALFYFLMAGMMLGAARESKV